MAEAAGLGLTLDEGETGFLFGEDQARYVITVPADKADAFNRIVAEGPEIPEAELVGFHRIGTVGGDSLLGNSIADLREANASFFRDWMGA